MNKFLNLVMSAFVAFSMSLSASAATITKSHFEGGKNLSQGNKHGSAGTLSELVMALQDADATQTTTNATFIKKDGTVAYTGAQSLGGFKITSLGTPTAGTDATTKTYVDARSAAVTCTAGAGGAATEVLVCTGLLATDTVLAVSQKTPGANSLPLLGWSTLANDAITGIWSADPGAGAVVLVGVKR